MLTYALRRVGAIIPALFAIITISFFVIRLAPGGPFDEEQGLPAGIRANLEAAYGLDQPLLVQYWRYISAVARGDLGPSLKFRDFTVAELIARGFPVSLALGLAALAVALIAGVALGTWAALRRSCISDCTVTTLAVVGVAFPGFVIGPLCALVFGLYLRWLPVAGWEGDLRHLILPVLTLALPVSAYIARLTRASLIDVLQTGYIRAARARGLGEPRIIWRHALRPALPAVVSYLGPAAAAIVTGSLVIESIFALPGTGRYLVQGAINRDYTLVMGMVVLYGTLTLLCNLAADVLHGWLDPEIRRGRA